MNNSNAKNREVTYAELAYLLYFSVMLGAKAIGFYEGQVVYNICLVLGALFFIVKIALTKNTIAEYMIVLLLLLFGGVVYLQSGEKSLLIFITMMLGMKGVSVERVFKTGTVIWMTAFISMYVLAVIGVIPEIAYTLDRHGWPPVLRHSLGYPHPNTLHVAYLTLTILILYSCKELSKKYITAIAIVLMMGNCYVFIYSLSRNGFLITAIYILILMYMVWRKNISNLEKWLIMLIYPLSALSMLIFPLVTSGEVFERLNMLFAGRFLFTHYFLTFDTPKLFGIRNIPVPEPAFVMDSSYVYLWVKLGIVAFVLYTIAMLFLIRHLLKNNSRAELAVVLALTTGGINETYLFNQSYKNLIFLFLGVFLYKCTAENVWHLPKAISVKQYGLQIGNKEIPLSTTNDGYRRRIPVNILVFSFLLFIVVGMTTSIVYVSAFPTPQDIYLPDEEITKGSGDEVYLTSEEVKNLKKQGNIVRGYVDENKPLYRMHRRGTVKIEYQRYIFSYGLWGGSLAAALFLCIWTARSKVRFLLRNRKIGEDYKENVLIVHNYYRVPGGEDIVVANEKELLESNGHKVILYSRNNEEAGDHNFFQKIGLAFVSILNFRTYRDVCKILEREKIDVIHVHNTVALISPAVYLAGINRGIPVVQTIHNFRLVCPNGVCYINDHVCERCIEHGLKASLLYNCYRNSKLQTFVCALTIKFQRILQTYRAIYYICLTEFNKQKLLSVKQIWEDHIYLKPNFTKIETSVVPYHERKKQIVYAGRIEKIKGVDMLLQAWMKLGDKAPKLVICGTGELEEWCREYIANNEIGNVEMLGQISNSDVKKLVGESLAIVYPTQWYEGFPMAVAEAYTMGTPIIASDIGNVGNLVVDGVTGMKFKSNSVVALANAIDKFMEKPVELPDEYLSMYTADSNYAILKSIYEDVRRKTYG